MGDRLSPATRLTPEGASDRTMANWDRIEWLDSGRMSLAGVSFRLSISDFAARSTRDDFVLMQTRSAIETLRELLAGSSPRQILDIGTYEGGSAVLYDLVFDPERLATIGDGAELTALASYIADRRRTDSLLMFSGLDQGDHTAMQRIVADHFPHGLDLVIDDASHRYEPTRASFECVFPALRPGAWYVIEDWGWNHWPGVWQEREVIPGPPLSRLVLELILAQAARAIVPDGEEIIEEIRTVAHIAAIRRGPGTWPPNKTFRIDDFLASRVPVLARDDGRATAERDAARGRVDAMLASTSWRVTAPFRWLVAAVRGEAAAADAGRGQDRV